MNRESIPMGSAPPGPADALRKRRFSRFGWVRDLPDARDNIYSVALPTLQKLPPKFDLRSNSAMPPVYDQGPISSCTANAIAAAIQFDRRRADAAPDFVPSRLFIYYNERVIEQDVPLDRGAQLRDGIKSVAKLGVCAETDWPYDPTPPLYDGGPFPEGDRAAQQPSSSAYTIAAKYTVTAYQRLAQSISQLRGCLWEGYPFVFGFTVHESFFIDGSDKQKTVIPLPTEDDGILGGHAVMAVGYDDTKQLFIVRNSWGPDQGENGYFYMPYAYVTDPAQSSDFWVIRAVASAVSPAPPASPPATSGATNAVLGDAPVGPKPVLVVHGVNVRDQAGFLSDVKTLGTAIQPANLQLLPAFWGNLGGRDFDPALIPQDGAPGLALAGAAGPDDGLDGLAIGARLSKASGGTGARGIAAPARGRDVLAARLAAHLQTGMAASTGGTGGMASIQQAVDEVAEQHPWIDDVQDPALHESIARLVASSMARQGALLAPQGFGFPGPIDLLKGLLKSALNEVLLLVADALASVGNGYVRQLREEIMPTVGRFTGDIWAYLSDPGPIRQAILGALAPSGLGTSPDKPISVVAHSFGGVIAVHMAVRELLYIDTLITFGSQPSLFEVIMRDYAPALGDFTIGNPVAVPGVIKKWINLWEPLDFLAFSQAAAFRLASGGPTDIRTPHLHDSGLFTHGVYWTHPLLAQTIRTAI